ncbi:MAG: hypothetical protein ACRDUA_04280, partial [Micromonosporaceae bacterium]
MIDLDPLLRPWIDEPPAWGEKQAMRVAREIAERLDMRIAPFDPPDEEWIIIGNDAGWAYISSRYPMAFAPDGVALPEDVVVARIANTDTEQVRASPDVLRATLLRHGWAEDF